MQINFGPTKTEAVVKFRGPGSNDLWKELLQKGNGKPQISFQSRASDHPQVLHLAPDYVHLGSLQDLSGNPSCEVKRRFLMLQAVKQLMRKSIFKSPRMPFSTRKQLFRSLLLSRLLFGSGAL